MSQNLRWPQVSDVNFLGILEVSYAQGNRGVLCAWLGIAVTGIEIKQWPGIRL